MGYTAPTTRASGYLVGPPNWNTEVVDNITFLANPPNCRVYHNANQSFADAVEASVAFNSERYDTDTMHDTVTNNTRVTFTTAGVYVVNFNGQFTAGNDYANTYAAVRLNGATYIAIGPEGRSVVGIAAQPLGVTTVYKFAAADYIEIRAMQNNTASAARNLEVGSNWSPELTASWLGLG